VHVIGRARKVDEAPVAIMLKSAFSYLSNAAATVGASASAGLAEVADSESRADPIVGSTVDVGGMSVRVRKRIGEGGFAFVYAVEQVNSLYTVR
jgi:uncharacterized protein (DUF2147 family)